MANWSKAFEALERGLGDQVNIGGLIHQTAQINEARAYDAALMMKQNKAISIECTRLKQE